MAHSARYSVGSPDFRNGGFDRDALVAHRVLEGDPPGVQGDSVRKLQVGAIFPIAENGVPAGGELDPDLVFPSSFQFHLKQRIHVQEPETSIGEPRFFRPFDRWAHDQHSTMPSVYLEPVDEAPLGRG